jgi:hypothetical protein
MVEGNDDTTEAVFALREAAERHGRAEAAFDQHGDERRRDQLLDARLDVEDKTKEAIAACQHCGLPHPGEHAAHHETHHGNVIDVDFGRA